MDYPRDTVDATALMERVGQLIGQGRPGAARPLLAAARGLAQPSSGLSLLVAQLALSDGTFDSAAEELDQALNLDPEHPGLRKCRAEVRRQLGDVEGAVRDAAEAVILDRTDPFAKALLGGLLLEIDRTADAIACLSEAVAAVPANIVFRETLAQTLTGYGDMDGALATLLEGIRIVPGAAALRNAAILLCIRHRDTARAADLAEQARLDGVADANTFGLKGHALSSLGRHEAAALAYNEALKLAPGDAHLRHLAVAAQTRSSAPQDFVRTLFDGGADQFETHIIELGYRIPGLIRRHVMEFAALANTGPVLDLGCGTGLVALALSDLRLGPLTGIDVSSRMLEQAREKRLYSSLREACLPAALHEDTTLWRLILAADVLCYFGALDEMFRAVFDRLRPGGRFIFSLEELLPDHDGGILGNGDWAPGRLGRHAHSARYAATTAAASGFRCLTLDRETLRYEAGDPVAGLLVVLERPRDDA
ncbi:MAG: methyltransferase domain-containing protein [Acetobacteraceae bacterium]|jgi:predicted TPR repeat methyltransferase/thioredoxin-like negative regulator of GroEL